MYNIIPYVTKTETYKLQKATAMIAAELVTLVIILNLAAHFFISNVTGKGTIQLNKQ